MLFLLGNSNGRKAIIKNDIVLVLTQLFDDSEVRARKNAHKAIEMLSELPFGNKMNEYVRDSYESNY